MNQGKDMFFERDDKGMPFPVAYCHRSDHYILMIAKLAIASHASVWSDAVLLRARG